MNNTNTASAPSAQQAAGSIRDFADFREDLERLSEPGLSKKQAKVIRKAIYDTIDARVRNLGAAATPAQPIAPAHIERFSIYEDHGRANMMGDDDGEYVLYSDHIEALGKVAQPIAVSAPTDERFKVAFDEWIDKTEWVQKQQDSFPFRTLGLHRADILKQEIDRLRGLDELAELRDEGWITTNITAPVLIKKLLTIVGNAYQVAGAHDAPEHILDVLANPEEATDEQIEAMLPYVPAPVSGPTVEKLMADMDTMRDEFASLSRALTFWLPSVPEEAGPIRDRVAHDAFFLTDGEADDKTAQELGWITLNAAPVKVMKATLGDVWASGGVHWDLFPGYLIDHRERDTITEEGLQFALAAMLKDADYLRVVAERKSAAPVSGQGASLPPLPEATEFGCGYNDCGGIDSDTSGYTSSQMTAYGQLCIDSRPRSEDSRAEVLEEVENIVLQQCTGMAARDIRLTRILDAIRALATSAAHDVAELSFNAQRLRNVAELVGLGKAVPESDAALDDARGAVLGMIASELRKSSAAPERSGKLADDAPVAWALQGPNGKIFYWSHTKDTCEKQQGQTWVKDCKLVAVYTAPQPSPAPQADSSSAAPSDLWIHEDMARDETAAVVGLPRKELKAAYIQAREDVAYWKRRALAAPAPTGESLTDEECDRTAAQVMDRVAANHDMHAIHINSDVRTHGTLRRELVRAGAALATPRHPEDGGLGATLNEKVGGV